MVWSFIHLSRLISPANINSLMTKEHYPQPLQSSWDDTEGAAQERVSFEPCIGQDYVGMVTLRWTNMKLPVYDAEGLVPDLGLIKTSLFWFFWVETVCIWPRGQKILRAIRLHELISIWDLEGKLQCQGKSQNKSLTLLQHCLFLPPGKLSHLMAYHLLDSRADFFILYLRARQW